MPDAGSADVYRRRRRFAAPDGNAVPQPDWKISCRPDVSSSTTQFRSDVARLTLPGQPDKEAVADTDPHQGVDENCRQTAAIRRFTGRLEMDGHG